MGYDVKLNIEQWIKTAKAKYSKKENKIHNELTQDILDWVNGGKGKYDGEVFSKWNKTLA